MKEIELVMIDESEPYEVDEAHVLYYPSKTFALKTASGCSCWDGEYDYENFDTLEQMEESLFTVDRRYSPTLVGARQLIAEARKALEALWCYSNYSLLLHSSTLSM